MKYLKLFEEYEYDNSSDLDDFYLGRYKLVDSSYNYYNKFQNEIKSAISKFKSHLNVFDKIDIRLFESLDSEDGIGMYSHESGVTGNPYIMLDYNNIVAEYNNNFELDIIIQSTIFHELGHAMVDIDNAYLLLPDTNVFHFTNEEVFVEDFAFDLLTFNNVDKQFKTFEELYLHKLKSGKLENNEEYYN